MRLTKHLKEIFDKTSKLKSGRQDETWYETTFVVDKIKYNFAAYTTVFEKGHWIWDVSFSRSVGLTKTMEMQSDLDMKQVLQVFATVKKCFEMFMAKMKPVQFYFSSKKSEGPRVKLYNRFAKQIERISPYKLKTLSKGDDIIYDFQLEKI